uniref:uncharacterized protein n=1 Tax=Pristiophorus japonicus TaxID=55135 RepID=UPI00398E9DB9
MLPIRAVSLSIGRNFRVQRMITRKLIKNGKIEYMSKLAGGLKTYFERFYRIDKVEPVDVVGVLGLSEAAEERREFEVRGEAYKGPVAAGGGGRGEAGVQGLERPIKASLCSCSRERTQKEVERNPKARSQPRESQSVTLNCTLHSEKKRSIFNLTQWTKGQPAGENLDNHSTYKGRLQKADLEAFGNERVCSNILGLTERDSETYYCNIVGEWPGVDNGNTLEIKCRTKVPKNAKTDITPVLLVALALIAVLIIFLTFRLIWGNKDSGDVLATTQGFPHHTVAREEPQYYAQLNIQQGRKKDRVNRNVDHVEYASINSLSMEAASSPIVQSPSSIHIFQGNSVTLNCTFSLKGVGTTSWRKGNTPLDFDSPQYKKRVTKPDEKAFKLKKDASIHIKNMTECESGMYYCEIEIMGQEKVVGNGTLVTVKHTCGKVNSLTKFQFDWYWIAVVGGGALLITVILLIVITVLIQRNKAYALLVR